MMRKKELHRRDGSMMQKVSFEHYKAVEYHLSQTEKVGLYNLVG